MATFTGVELYRSTTDLSIKTRTWCDTNATLLYSGTAETYSDSGLTSGELYYYKVFSVYLDDGQTVYSNGVATTCVTGTIPLVVTAIANTANTVQLTFNTNMADPTDKEDEFSVSIGGGSGGDYQEWENYPDSPFKTSLYPYQFIAKPYNKTKTYLYCNANSFYRRSSVNDTVIARMTSPTNIKFFELVGDAWVLLIPSDWDLVSETVYGAGSEDIQASNGIPVIYEANNDMFNEVGLSTILFYKTTSSSTPLTITSLTQPSSKVYQLNISETMLNTDEITATYTKGTVESSAGIDLEDFSETVTNNI